MERRFGRATATGARGERGRTHRDRQSAGNAKTQPRRHESTKKNGFFRVFVSSRLHLCSVVARSWLGFLFPENSRNRLNVFCVEGGRRRADELFEIRAR